MRAAFSGFSFLAIFEFVNSGAVLAQQTIDPGFACVGVTLSALGRIACADQDVARLSKQSNTTYRALQTATDDAGRLRLQAVNEAWLNSTEAKCGENPTKACIIEAFDIRLRQLGQTPPQSSQPQRSQLSLDCSAQADARGLHGAERAAFRSHCKGNVAPVAQQTTQQLTKPAVFMPTQECAAKYQMSKVAGTLAGRQWIEFRDTECRLGNQPKPNVVLPNGNMDVFSYCKTVINLDSHKNTTIDRQSEVALAKALNTEAFDWRCMDGDVFACTTGASGSACQKMSASKRPTTAISAFCALQPNTQFVPMSVIGNSPASWKCAGFVPQILESVQLDKRNFMKGSWTKVDREAPQLQAPAATATPPAAVPLSQEEIEAFRKFMGRWSPPPGVPSLDVHFRLKRDGTIDGTPEVLSNGKGSAFEAAKEDAVRTVLQGQPFKMFRPESYDAWKDMVVTFEAPAVPIAEETRDQERACVARYDSAKTAGEVGDISRENFLKVCALTGAPVIPEAEK